MKKYHNISDDTFVNDFISSSDSFLLIKDINGMFHLVCCHVTNPSYYTKDDQLATACCLMLSANCFAQSVTKTMGAYIIHALKNSGLLVLY